MADRTITHELLRTYGVDRDLPCPRCRYNLRGLVGNRCPECGKDVESYLKKASIGGGRGRIIHLTDVRERVLAFVGPTLALGLASGSWLAVHVSGAPLLIDRIAAGMMVLLVLAAGDVWWQLVRRVWRRVGAVGVLLRGLLVWAPPLAGAAAVVVLAP
jgi:hypothetical protein